MRVLVAGGAGYIGSHTCKALAHAGHLPIAYDNLHAGHSWAVKWGPLVQGDINDPLTLAAAIREHRPDAVVNFAALAYVGESMVEPMRYYRANVGGMITLIEVMRAHGVGRIVFSSSCATYGVPDVLPVVEGTRQLPINTYGHTKLMGEQILHDACTAHGLGAIALRYFNAGGADPEGELGEEHDPETHIIPLVLQAAHGTRREICIFGTDYDTPDGTCVRDYVHVTDLAAAHVAALSRCEAGNFQAYNLGGGQGASIGELVDRARRLTGREIRTVAAPRRAGDPPVLVADVSRARQALGWAPAHSAIDDIIGSAWMWMTDSRRRAMQAKAR
ncbi:UDP-glucose 4-epimerase GalE [Reyranella sp.]|uniref:UDP-glucose 4-epimerase GalE n=1 Tax=Reyranella sp. TaxID=1929291 RepID=UPI00260253A0|nr:UDP-glucose 4-epimerase GalE [Reyranella sp.]HQS17995.1 UDP-glucose 4-epimerase GalE [Reyranella sp.]HQT14570.1 UDP-glucose 4-epimerase GalE [Reyranella sp.]